MEFLKFLPQSQHEHITRSSIKIGAESIDTSTKAKNLGVIIDPSLNLASHITATGRAANDQLYCLSRIKISEPRCIESDSPCLDFKQVGLLQQSIGWTAET